MITGTTNNSRLIELKKYAVGVSFSQQYFGGGSVSNDGVDYGNSVEGDYITYYLGGIKFVDDVSEGTTTFSYTPSGGGDNVEYYLGTGMTSSGTEVEFTPSWVTTLDFIDEPYYKDPNESKIISNPKINNDVFITRDQQSAFDKNYKMEFIERMVDLTTYAGGKYFNIINNT
jgi:hypothetical protein